MLSVIQKKRLAKEKQILKEEPLHYATAYQNSKNPLLWHCLYYGQTGTPYEGGQYIFNIELSKNYPFDPPDYYMLTPCGRYELDRKICLTNSAFHKDAWTSSWNTNTMMIAFVSVFLDDGEHGLAHIVPSSEADKERLDKERRKLAKQSIEYNKTHLGEIYAGFDFTHLRLDEPTPKKTDVETRAVDDIVLPVPPPIPVLDPPHVVPEPEHEPTDAVVIDDEGTVVHELVKDIPNDVLDEPPVAPIKKAKRGRPKKTTTK